MSFNTLSSRVGAEFPIFAFSHCRDVVIEVSRSGGVGVLGAARMSPARLDSEMHALDAALRGLPYGVDILFPRAVGTLRPPGRTGDAVASSELQTRNVEFARQTAAELGLRMLPDTARAEDQSFANGPLATLERATALADVALGHPIRVLVSALGPIPMAVQRRTAEMGVAVGGSVGDVRHVRAHLEAGVDFLIAQGSEAGGHTGPVATSVLVPDVVDVAGDTPVLAAGGIGSGRQIAAALAWGACGVWIGSLWLTTVESDVQEGLRSRLLDASSQDAVVTRSISGRPMRVLRNAWTDRWAATDSPTPLSMPHQGAAVAPVLQAAIDQSNLQILTTPVGQIVSRMTRVRRTADVMFDLKSELLETLHEMSRMLGALESESVRA